MKFDGRDELNPVDRLRVVGKGVNRVDGPLKVTGLAPYAYDRQDVALNHAYGYVLGAGIARGRLTEMHIETASSAPGVLTVVTAETAGDLELGMFNNARLLAGPEIEHYHQAVALVVADSFEEARAAAQLIRCTYERANNDSDLRAFDGDWITPAKVPGGDMPDTEVGDFTLAFAQTEVQLDQFYETPNQSPAMMEPHASIAAWSGDRVILWTSTQMVDWVKNDLARTLGIEAADVRVSSPYVGGGFGSKTSMRADALLAVLGARATGRPVRVALTRSLLFNNTQHRGATRQRIRIGTNQGGRIKAIGHETWSGDLHGVRAEAGALPTRLLYAGAHRMTRTRVATLDLPECGPMRAPGEASGLMALEIAMDEMAEKLGMDPIEFRIRNETSVDPERPERPFSERRLVECFRTGAERFGWSERSPRPRHRREGRWMIGHGTAAALRNNLLVPSAARVRLTGEGRIIVETDMTDIGTGSYTIIAQTAAEMMGVPLNRVEVRLGDSEYPISCGSAGQFGAASSTAGVYAACMKLRKVVARRVGINADDAVFECGEVRSAGLAVALERAAADGEVVAEDSMEYSDLSAVQQSTFGAHFVEVGVDSVTAEVRVRRMLAVCDAGRILNPKSARSQVIGAMVMGVGAALMEELAADSRHGFFVNHDFAGYEIPVHADIPEQEVIFLRGTDNMSTPMKAKGVGELGICGVAAAIANAIYNAIGVRVRDYPITLDKILAKMAAGA